MRATIVLEQNVALPPNISIRITRLIAYINGYNIDSYANSWKSAVEGQGNR